MVLNGLEMASGSIRINRAELQTRVLDVIGIDPAEAEERFGFLLRALRFGAPPHGGIAPGIDRIAMQLGDTDNLREVVAFPKLGGGADPLTGAPAPLSARAAGRAGAHGRAQDDHVGSGRAHLRRSRGDDAGLRRGLGPRCSPSCASISATPRSRTGPVARRDAAWTTRALQAAEALGVAGADVVFTGGASEADNIAILGRAARGPGRIVTTPLEHPAVSGAVESLERQGCEIATLPVDADGRVPVGAFDEAVQPGDLVCSLIWASNLTGVIQPVAEAAAICAERGVPLHLDAVQACPALEVDIGSLPGTVTAAVAGHKLGGPKGAGLLCGRGLATLRAGVLRRRSGARAAARHRECGAGSRPGGGARGRSRRSGALRPLPRGARRVRGGSRGKDDGCLVRRRARRAHAGTLAGAAGGPARTRPGGAAGRAGHRRGGRAGLRQRRVEREPRADGHGCHAGGGDGRAAAQLRHAQREPGTASPPQMPSRAAPRSCGAPARSCDAAGARSRARRPRGCACGRGLRGRQRVRRPRAHHAGARRRRAHRRRALRRLGLRARDRGRRLGLPPGSGARVSGRCASVARGVRRRAGAERARTRMRRGCAGCAARGPR